MQELQNNQHEFIMCPWECLQTFMKPHCVSYNGSTFFAVGEGQFLTTKRTAYSCWAVHFVVALAQAIQFSKQTS